MQGIWQSLVDFISTTLYVSPFWMYLGEGVAAIAAISLVSWYFPVLRSVAGALVFGIIFALFGYRKGEKDAESHAAKVKKVERDDPWRW